MTLANLGISAVDLIRTAYSNPKAMHELSKKVISIDWKPVSVFPKEAQRFR